MTRNTSRSFLILWLILSWSLFADDAKLFKHITKDSDKTELQNGVNAPREWTKINKTFSMLGIIKRNFKHLTIQLFTMLYKTW